MKGVWLVSYIKIGSDEVENHESFVFRTREKAIKKMLSIVTRVRHHERDSRKDVPDLSDPTDDHIVYFLDKYDEETGYIERDSAYKVSMEYIEFGYKSVYPIM